MPTPHNTGHGYVTLGGLLLRTRAIDCFDTTGLFAVTKRGSNRAVPGRPGRARRQRVTDELRVGLPIRIRGDYDHDNQPVSGGVTAWVDNFFALIHQLRGVCDVNGPQDLVFTWPTGEVTVDAIVEEMGPPNDINPWTVTLVLDVTLSDGPLDLTPTPPDP